MVCCMIFECYGCFVFYGVMIIEGIVVLIWVVVVIYFYCEYGMEENNVFVIVDVIMKDWFGVVGGVFVILGVIVVFIILGDIVFCLVCLIVVDFLKLE